MFSEVHVVIAFFNYCTCTNKEVLSHHLVATCGVLTLRDSDGIVVEYLYKPVYLQSCTCHHFKFHAHNPSVQFGI